ASARFMSPERISDDRADVVSDERGERRSALVIANAMHDDGRRSQAPDLPRLAAGDLEPFPTGLVEPDHGLCLDVVEQRRVDQLEPLRDRVREIPERLRSDDQTATTEDARLALERDVTEPLVDEHFDRERERVATAGKRAVWTERGVDAAAAPAHVLLLLHLDELVGDLDDIDHLRLFELSDHLVQLAAAARARAIRMVERELLLDDRQIRLLRRFGRLTRFRRWLLLLGLVDRVLSLLGLGLELLEHLERQLEVALAAASTADHASLFLDELHQEL